MKRPFLMMLLWIAGTIGMTAAQENVITVQTARKGAPISATMYGIFYEDINFAADGGMYAEMVKNRSFEYTPDALMGWNTLCVSVPRGMWNS